MHKVTRRHVIASFSASTVMLCPRILTAQTLDPGWGDIPTTTPIGQDQLIEVAAGPAEIDISALNPGEVAVIARPSDSGDHSATEQVHYVAVMNRTEEQVAAANDGKGAYLVVDLTCPHRGKAVGMTGDPALPFACTDRGSRHSSVFDVAGNGVSGASDDEALKVPEHSISGTMLSLA